MIQTYDPGHYAVKTAAAQDYEAFYEEEIRYRELMGYPPVEHLLAVLVSSGEETLLEKGCHYLKAYILRVTERLKKNAGEAVEVQVIGPASPGIDKIKDIYRRVIYIKSENYGALVGIKDRIEQYIEINSGFNKIRVQFDFDPM